MLMLPYPPSVNTYWRANGNRRFISKAGVIFKKAVADYVSENKVPKLGAARLSVCIIVCPRSKRLFDIDNICKAVLDSLMDAGVYDDDSQVDKLYVQRGVPFKGGRCLVAVDVIPQQE